MIPVGPILMLLLLISVACDLMPNALARLGLSQRQAMAGLMAIAICSLVEVVLAPGLIINLGTGLLPLLLVLYAYFTGQPRVSLLPTVVAAIVTAAAVFLVGLFFPPGVPTELNLFGLDAQYLYALTAGAAACAVSRHGAAAYSTAVVAVLLSDLAQFGWATYQGTVTATVVQVGGGSNYATPLVAGVLALWLAGLMGETEGNMTGMDRPVSRRWFGLSSGGNEPG